MVLPGLLLSAKLEVLACEVVGRGSWAGAAGTKLPWWAGNQLGPRKAKNGGWCGEQQGRGRGAGQVSQACAATRKGLDALLGLA